VNHCHFGYITKKKPCSLRLMNDAAMQKNVHCKMVENARTT
jgi:hypothetical protein